MVNVLSEVSGKVRRRILGAVSVLSAKARSAQGVSMPRVELSDRHLRHLRVVPDRRALLILLPQNGVVAELGVASGDFSAMILDQTRPTVLHLIDCWTSTTYSKGQQRVRARFARGIERGQVVVNVGLSVDTLGRFEDGVFDWVYIDTDHTYQTTKLELELCALKVKGGGVIAGHDYVTGSWDGGVRYGVVEAVQEFCVKYDWELVLLTHELDRHLSFAIRKINASGDHAERETG